MNPEPSVAEPAADRPAEERLTDGIFYRHWHSQAPLRAVVLLAHGLGEHTGRYQTLAAYLGERGFAVVAPDHYGHGLSPGKRAHIDHFADYFPPLSQLRDAIDGWYPAVPVFLLGHSMGGLIVTRYLLENQQRFAGAVLSGAALQPADPPSAFTRGLSRWLARLWPGLRLLKLDPEEVSRDPNVVRGYREDPLVHSGRITVRLADELFNAMEAVTSRWGELSLPLLIMHGGEDAMTAPEGSEALHAGVGSTDKQLLIYPGLYHEIFQEPEQLSVFADLEQWLSSRS